MDFINSENQFWFQLELFEDLAEYEWAHHMEQVHGTDGTRFNPKSIEVGASLDIWVGELYRSLKVSSKEQVDFSGVDVVRFEIVSIPMKMVLTVTVKYLILGLVSKILYIPQNMCFWDISLEKNTALCPTQDGIPTAI